MKVISPPGNISSPDEPFLSFIWKLRKELVDPVNRVKPKFKRLYPIGLAGQTGKSSAFPDEKQKVLVRFKIDIPIFSTQSMRVYSKPARFISLDEPFLRSIRELRKVPVNPVNPVKPKFKRLYPTGLTGQTGKSSAFPGEKQKGFVSVR